MAVILRADGDRGARATCPEGESRLDQKDFGVLIQMYSVAVEATFSMR